MPIAIRSGSSNDGYIVINGVDAAKVTTQGWVGPPVGQCRFQYTNTTTCTLVPFQGNQLTIAGINYTIPSAGVTLAATGLTVSSLYYVYAYMSGTTMTLEASLTGHSVDTTTGIEIKTGDSSRTLVGMVRPIAGPNFSDTIAVAFVASWFNRRQKGLYNTLASNYGVSATTAQSIAIVQFLSWVGDAIMATTTGAIQGSTAGAVTFYGISLNSAAGIAHSANYWQAYAASSYGAFSTALPINIGAEGYNYLYSMGWVNSGSTTFLAGCSIAAQIVG